MVCPWTRQSFVENQKTFVGSMVYNNLRVFVKNKYRIHLVLPRSKISVGTEGYEGISVHEFPVFDLPFQHSLILKLLRRLVLYVCFVSVATIATLRVVKTYGKPLVLYGYTGTGVASAYLSARVLRVPNISRFFGATYLTPYLKSRLRMLFYNFEEVIGYKLGCKYMIITDDGTQGDVVAETLKVPMNKVRYWMNGFLIEKPLDKIEARSQLKIDLEKSLVLCVGRLVKSKNFHKVIEAMPNIHGELLVVGDGYEKANLTEQARSLGVEDKVKFVGAVPHEDVSRYLCASDVYVSMQDTSNVSSTFLEALTLGSCIVASDVGETNKFIKHRENGYLLKDSVELAPFANRLLNNVEERKRLGLAAKESAHFLTWTERGKMELELIEGITH